MCEIGPGECTHPPKWTHTEIGGRRYRHPLCVSVHFPAGTLLDETGCVIRIETRETVMYAAEVSAYVTPDNQAHARAVLDRLADCANELNPYRGRAVLAATATLQGSRRGIQGQLRRGQGRCAAADRPWRKLSVSAVRCCWCSTLDKAAIRTGRYRAQPPAGMYL
ncbi:hypothetical protein [Mycobacterium persicum]|uniref:Uncharacterized protein n=1 Tax=Mycobacterium persicum TaxID=1487726 RepID=A0AB38UZ18_9MYCO|nr:hypothetical protein [Mycobacterium persicum]VAZ85743.1 hypothetical protein LAUMK42_04581 [Mycobacterium persicum]